MYAYIHNYQIHQDHRAYLHHPDHQHYQPEPYFSRPLRAPGRQGPKNGHFTKGCQ